MNKKHLETIFKNYIDHFEEINVKMEEYYKWQIAKDFRPLMDDALAADPAEFAPKLLKVQRITGNLTDSGHALPFTGLVKAAEKDPESVQELFKFLYDDGMNDQVERQRRAESFLKQSEEIIERTDLGGHLYKNTFRSVSVYMALYDPDNNYILKPSDSREFADCVEFYDDWGQGMDVKLDVYYRMCDQLVDAIKQDAALMKTDASRFSNGWGVDPESLHPDPEKHILAFDIIYCASRYGLYSGVDFDKTTSKERQLHIERKKKAEELIEALDQRRALKARYDEAADYLHRVYAVGSEVTHKKYGKGTILSKDGGNIEVEFPALGVKKLGLALSAANGIISTTADGYSETLKIYQGTLKKSGAEIERAVENAEKALEPYLEFLE